MMTRVLLNLAATLLVVVALATASPAAQQRGRQTTATTPKAATPAAVESKAACAGSLGPGVKTKRAFCDVIIGSTGDDSLSMQIPAHTGAATFYFDLHPRYEVTDPDADPAKVFQRHRAIVAIVGPTGDVIDRRAVAGEYRTTTDLFDRVAGDGPGGFKVVSPGMPSTMKVTIPAGISAIGLVGLRLELMNRFTQQAYAETGRPIAIVSSWRIEYTPR